MPRRIEIELTSQRPDGTWTWRAAGARQPKGEVDAALLPPASKVGEVLRADAEFMVDGIDIVLVLPPKAARKEPEFIAVIGTKKDEPLVTTQLAPKGRGDRPGRRDGEGRGRGDRPGGDRPRGDRSRGDRPGGDRAGGDRRPRGPRPDPVPERPRPKRLRPGRTHRNAVLEQIPAEQRPVAEQVLRGGVPAVRSAIEEQNKSAREAGRPEVPAEQLVAMAEQLLPTLREAEWRDKADAALRDLDELDLRDLRSVVVAADGSARDAEALAQLESLRIGLARRIEEEHAIWLADIQANLDSGRFVRALRLTSRPPKAGAPLPVDLAVALSAAVSQGLNSGTNQELWAAAIDALAVSPIRNQVAPTSRPEEPNEALVTAVRRAADRLPALATLFGVEPMSAKERKRSRPGKPRIPAPPTIEKAQETPAASEAASSNAAPDGEPAAEVDADNVAAVAAETSTETASEAATENAESAEPTADSEVVEAEAATEVAESAEHTVEAEVVEAEAATEVAESAEHTVEAEASEAEVVEAEAEAATEVTETDSDQTE